MVSRRHPRIVTAAVAVLAASVAAACAGPRTAGDRVRVEAAFYPLAFVARVVGGDHVDVHDLTRPGAEPHDTELRARDVAALADADLTLYLHGFQPSVDQAIGEAGDRAFDVAPVAHLEPFGEHADDDHAGHEHAGDEHDHDHDHEGGLDPHFWLDPTRLAAVTTAVGDRLAAVDPDHAATYRANAAALRTRLLHLDRDFAAGLATCRSRDLVTNHEAFGYLARRYHLTQRGISGLSPETEPTAAQLGDATRFVRTHRVRTIYFETLASPAVARTVAAETGATTAVLDPLEGLTDASAGPDYLAVMAANLRTLRAGQDCR